MAHLESSSSADGNHNSGSDISRSTAERKQTTGNSDHDSNGLRFNFDLQKPLSYNKSVPSFLDERIFHLQVDDGRRSRSHSEPLTREAVVIAQQLRKASDLFNTNYETFSPAKREFDRNRRGKSRRITLGGSVGESLRQEVNQALRANRDSFPGFNPIPPEGTPV